MKVTAIKTGKITIRNKNLYKILDKYIPTLKERSVFVMTSKIVAICEGRLVKIGKIEKDTLIKREADYFLPLKESPYHFYLTIKNNILLPSAGIDESNGNGYYILWPKNPQKTANEVRRYLKKRFSLQRVGVIITDSKTTPQRWGVTGIAIAHSGFKALNDYRGRPDIFGRKFTATQVSVMDGLAAAAVLAMGEGNEQTPLAIIEDIPLVRFQPRNPTQKELRELKIGIKEDLYAPLLTSVRWEKGRDNCINRQF